MATNCVQWVGVAGDVSHFGDDDCMGGGDEGIHVLLDVLARSGYQLEHLHFGDLPGFPVCRKRKILGGKFLVGQPVEALVDDSKPSPKSMGQND